MSIAASVASWRDFFRACYRRRRRRVYRFVTCGHSDYEEGGIVLLAAANIFDKGVFSSGSGSGFAYCVVVPETQIAVNLAISRTVAVAVAVAVAAFPVLSRPTPDAELAHV